MHARLERLTRRLNSDQIEKRIKKIEGRGASKFTFNRLRARLEEPDVLWKTPSEVAQETGLDKDTTELMIDTLSHERDEILCSSHPHIQTGEARFTTRRHFKHTAPWFLHLKGILAGGID